MTTERETEGKEPGEPTDEQVQEREDAEEKEAIERKAPGGAVVHRAILEEGEDELRRPTSALAWSGLSAGLSMGFSFISEALLRASTLPDARHGGRWLPSWDIASRLPHRHPRAAAAFHGKYADGDAAAA